MVGVWVYLIALAESALDNGARSVKCLSELGFEKNYSLNITREPNMITRQKIVARGGFGVIYDLPTAPSLIFKYINATNPVVKNLTLIEINTMISLNSTNIIPHIYDCIVVNKNWVGIVMDRLYKPLEDVLDQFRLLSPKRRLYLYLRVVHAVIQIHRAGYLHNDIKPGNIMITDDSMIDIRLIDFGISCKIGFLCQGGTNIFSPPEKINGNLNAIGTETLDVWSILILFVFCEFNQADSYLFEEVTKECFQSMTQDCHTKLAETVKKMTFGWPPGLGYYVVSSLDYVPEKRPTMIQLYYKIKSLYTTAYMAELSSPQIDRTRPISSNF